jgi:hypothetical protein
VHSAIGENLTSTILNAIDHDNKNISSIFRLIQVGSTCHSVMLIAAYLVTLLCPYSHANHLPENPHHSCFPHLLTQLDPLPSTKIQIHPQFFITHSLITCLLVLIAAPFAFRSLLSYHAHTYLQLYMHHA